MRMKLQMRILHVLICTTLQQSRPPAETARRLELVKIETDLPVQLVLTEARAKSPIQTVCQMRHVDMNGSVGSWSRSMDISTCWERADLPPTARYGLLAALSSLSQPAEESSLVWPAWRSRVNRRHPLQVYAKGGRV